MPGGGLFKHLLWIAPVLGILFFYITSQQKVADDKMDAEFAEFDEKFDRMQESMSTGELQEEWREEKNKSHEKRMEAEARAAASVAKDDQQFKEMERDLAEFKSEN